MLVLLIVGQALAIEKEATFRAEAASLAVSDRYLVVGTTRGDALVFSLAERRLLRRIPGSGDCVALADGELVAGTSKNEKFLVRILDPETGKEKRRLERSVPLAAHRGVLATGGFRSLRVHGLARLDERAFWKRKDIRPAVEVFPFARDGTLAARAHPVPHSPLGRDARLLLWKPPYKGEPRLLAVPGGFETAGLSPRADVVALGLALHNRAEVRDATTGKLLHRLPAHGGEGDVTVAAYSPNGARLLTISGVNTFGVAEAIVWEVPGYREVGRIDLHRGECRQAAWLPDGSGFATAGITVGEVVLWRGVPKRVGRTLP